MHKEIYKMPFSELKEGINFLDQRQIIVWNNGKAVTACKNKCRHYGAKFHSTGAPCELECSGHRWKLNMETMEYTNPHGGLVQNRLLVSRQGEELVLISA